MAQLAKISIITPSFNQAKFITRTVRSVILQRYPNLEYVLMDGGSKDGTMEALAPYREAFAYFRSEKDDGQAAAIADGFDITTGDIMGYLNSDDMLAPGSLEFVNWFFANHPDVDAIYSHRIAVDESDRALWYWILPPHSNYLMSRWDYIPQETCFWRRSLWTKAGNIDRTFRFAMDYDFFVRCMQCGSKFRRVNRFLGAFRWHNAAKSSRLYETIGMEEIDRIWKTYGLAETRLSHYAKSSLSGAVNSVSNAFARHCIVLPGNLPGINYSYDRVWGGLLTQT